MPQLHAYVVEDNPILCEHLAGTLQELTCVRVIGSGSSQAQSAQWLVRHAHDWDLLVVDLFLRGGSGMRLLEELGPRQSWQKVVLFSNYLTAAVRKRCAQVGVDAVFDKSTEIDALVDYCARLCFLRGQALAGADAQARPPDRETGAQGAAAAGPARR